jgi:hypothetical protein
VFVLIHHYRPVLSMRAENIPSTRSLFKLQSVALIVLLQLESRNNRNESYIEFVSDESSKYNSIDDFYNATIVKLWEGLDSEENTIRYIKN